MSDYQGNLSENRNQQKTHNTIPSIVWLVKQVIRCMQVDQQLSKGSWSKLLTGVGFHMTALKNVTSCISPHILKCVRILANRSTPGTIISVGVRLTPMRNSSKHSKGRESSYAEYQTKFLDEPLQAQEPLQYGKPEPEINKEDKVMLNRNMV